MQYYLLFILVTIAVYAGLLYWFHRRFVVYLTDSAGLRRAILSGLIGLYPAVYLLRRVDRFTRFDTVEPLLIVLYSMFVFLILLALGVLARDVISAGIRGVDALWRRLAQRPGFWEEDRRRRFLRVSSRALIPVALLLLGVGAWQALSAPVLREIPMETCSMPANAELRFAVLSDAHVGPVLGHAHVERMAALLRDAPADAVFIPGDLVDGPPDRVAPLLESLRDLGKPVFFVSGNHELYWGRQAWNERMRDLGFTVLEGDFRILEIRGLRVLVAGIADEARWSMGLARSRIPVPGAPRSAPLPEADVRILLAHRSDAAFSAAAAKYDLMVSGHTHGGQFFPMTMLDFLFERGVHDYGNMKLVISTGAGFWGPPVRLFNPPEILLLRVRGCTGR